MSLSTTVLGLLQQHYATLHTNENARRGSYNQPSIAGVTPKQYVEILASVGWQVHAQSCKITEQARIIVSVIEQLAYFVDGQNNNIVSLMRNNTNALNTEVSNRTTSETAIKDRLTRVENTLGAQESQSDALNMSMTTLTQRLQEASGKVENLMAQRAQDNARIETLEREKSELDAANQTLQATVRELQQNTATLQEGQVELKHEVTDVKSNVARIDASVEDNKEEITKLKLVDAKIRQLIDANLAAFEQFAQEQTTEKRQFETRLARAEGGIGVASELSNMIQGLVRGNGNQSDGNSDFDTSF